MADNNNPYGAPTQGLGQNITFAQGVQQTPTVNPPAYQTGSYSVNFAPTSALGQTAVVNVGSPEVDALWGLVSKVAGERTEQAIAAARQERFVAGMQMAQTGKTAAEIAADQPFFARLFGADTDVVSGATAYNKAAQTAELLGSLEVDPKLLATMDADTLRAQLSAGLQGAMTGDPLVDGTVMGEYARHAPGLIARWTRARVAQQQQDAALAFDKNLVAGAKLFSTAFRANTAGGAPPEDNDRLASNFLEAFKKPDGMSPAAWQEAVFNHANFLSETGEFHALSVIDPLLSELPAKAQAQVRQQAQVNAHQLAASPTADAFHAAWHSIKVAARNGEASVARVHEVAGNLNQQWFRQTGSPLPFVGAGAMVTEAGTAQHYIDALDSARAKRAITDAAQIATQQGEADARRVREFTMSSLLMSGDYHLLASSSFKADEREALIYRHANGVLNAPELDAGGLQTLKRLGNLVGSPGAGGDVMRELLHTQANAGVIGGPTSPAFAQAFATFTRIRDNAPAGLAAYPDDLRQRYAMFAQVAPTGIPVTADGKADQSVVTAWQRLFQDRTTPLRVQVPSDKDLKAATGQMHSALNSMLPEALIGSIDVNATQFQLVAQGMRETVSTLQTLGLPVSGDTMTAYWERGGGRAIGGFLWRDQQQRGKTTEQLFKQGDSTLVFGAEDFNIGTHFREFVDSYRKQANEDAALKDVVVLPNGDGSGLIISIPGRRPGEWATAIPVSYTDVGKYLHKVNAEAQARVSKDSVRDTNARIDAWRRSAPAGQLSPDQLRRATY